jgi:hypothetical protein
MSIAAPAAAARTRSDHLAGRSATTIVATPATATPTARRTNADPASDPSSVPSCTPTARRSSSVITTMPAAASAHAVPNSQGRATAEVPNASKPTTDPPNRRARPTYSPHRPATASAVGGGVSSPVRRPPTTSSAETPTPKVNALLVRWPSVFDTVRQATG